MKTILIPIFQGVEARNILRTDIFKILKDQKDIRLVLLTLTQEKKDYFAKEFSGDNVSYEVFENYKIPGLNRIFTFLKYNLLKTKRMDLRRRIKLAETGNFLSFGLTWVFNRLFARPFFRGIVRSLDWTLVRDDNFGELLKKYRPDLVLLAHLFGDLEISLLRQAKKQGIKTVGIINSWDKITSRCIVRLLPDKMIVHNNIVKQEALQHADMKEPDLMIAGIPHYDIFFKNFPRAKEIFYKEINCPLDKRIIIFCPTGQFYSDIDDEIINCLTDFQLKGQLPEDVKILVRFPPNDTVETSKLKNQELLLFDQPGVRFSAKRGIDWDMNDHDMQKLLDTLYYSSLVICPPSSISVDAAVFDKPIINIKFEKYKGYSNKNINLFYDADHYRNITKTGGIKLVETEADLLEAIKRYLNNPALDADGRKTIVSEQCWKTDGAAGRRVAEFLLSIL